MRIVYLNPNGTIGGAETSLLDLMTVLRGTEPDWSLSLITGADGPLLTRAKAIGVSSMVIPFPLSLRRLGDSGLGSPSQKKTRRATFLANLLTGGVEATTYLSRLRKAVRELNPDLVHSNGFKMHLLSAYAPTSNVPLLWHIHDYVGSRPVTAPLLRLCAKRCSAAVTNSHSVAADLRLLLSSSLDIEPVHNGVDIEAFAPDGPSLDLDALAGLPQAAATAVRIGFVGTFARWKGHEIFLRALSMLNSGISFRGYVIGGPIYDTNDSQHSLAELRSLADGLGLSGKVAFTGFIQDPAAAFRSLDIVVHASTEPEPFGLVIVEAMACGKAVVVSNSGGPSEIVQDRLNALSHEPGDTAALAARIEELATNPSLREELGNAARRTTEHRFDRRRFAGEFARIYRRLAITPN